MRKPIVAGNWKLNLTASAGVELATSIKASCHTDQAEVVVCPVYTALSVVANALKGSRISVGAQDLFWEPSGAFTGEVSAPLLADAGCRFVIIGHSERRTYFGETDEHVAKKVKAALAAELTPIVCIGETLAQRDANQTFAVLTAQLDGGLGALTAQDAARLVVAYEPVWAIGTGRTATPQQAQEAHAHIRRWLGKKWGAGVAETVRIQYGGSVNAGNAATLLEQPDVDGALVGGASLKADSFAVIVNAARDAKKAVAK